MTSPCASSALLQGYFGRRNTGDDALLAASGWAAKRLLGSQTIYATAGVMPHTYGVEVRAANFPDHWPFVGRLNLWRERRVAKNIATIIYGGGSNFHTASKMEWYLRVMDEAPAGRHFGAGISIGPFRNRQAEAACKRLLGRLEFVGVRDVPSLQRARELAPSVNAQLTFDIAPLLLALDVHARKNSRAQGLGVVLRGLATASASDQLREARRLQAIASAIKQLYGDGLIDEVVVFDFSEERSCVDRLLHGRLLQMLPKALRARRVGYMPDPIAMLHEVSKLQVMLAMRLHASIFGYLSGVPSVTLSYHEKCKGWCDMIGQDSALVLDAELAGSADIARSLRLALLGLSARPRLSTSDAFERALLNWTWSLPPAAATSARTLLVSELSHDMRHACNAAD